MADIVLETFGGSLRFRWSCLICMLNTRSRNYAWECVNVWLHRQTHSSVSNEIEDLFSWNVCFATVQPKRFTL